MEENCEQDRLMVGVKTLARHLRAEQGGEDVPADDEMIQPALQAAPGETGWSMGIPRDAAIPKQGGGCEAKVHQEVAIQIHRGVGAAPLTGNA